MFARNSFLGHPAVKINTRENFMNKLWGSSGKVIKNTGFGDGIITEMRTKLGTDIEVTVFLTDVDCTEIMSGEKLWEMGAEIV